MADGDGNPRLSFRGGEIVQRRMPTTKVIMTATPRQALAGEVVTLTWGVTEGTAEFHDWLGLFSENDDKKPLRHCYVKTNKRGGEWSVEAPREAGKYVFRFIKSLFPYDLIHKDYLGLARSNVWEVVDAGANAVDGNFETLGLSDADQVSVSPNSTSAASNPDAGGVGTGQSPAGSSPFASSSWKGLTSPSRAACSIGPRSGSGSGHVRSGSGGSATSLLGAQLATHAEGIVGRLPVHPLAWILKRFSSDDDLQCVKLEDVVELSHQVEDDIQAGILARRLAAAAEQPGPGRRAVVDAGGVGGLLQLARWMDPDIQKHAAHGLHSLVTYVPTLHGGMHDPLRRALTFGADFPHREAPLSPTSMAHTGLYSQPLEPGSDRVLCIACGVILEGWTKGQVPAQVHMEASPHCRLLHWPNAQSCPLHNAQACPAAQSPAPAALVPTAQDLPPPNQPIYGWGQALAGGKSAAAASTSDLGRAWGAGGSHNDILAPMSKTSSWHTPSNTSASSTSSSSSSSTLHHASSSQPPALSGEVISLEDAAGKSRSVGRPSVVTWWPQVAHAMGRGHAVARGPIEAVDMASKHASPPTKLSHCEHIRAKGFVCSAPGGDRVVSAPPTTTTLNHQEEADAGGVKGGEDEAGGVGVLELGNKEELSSALLWQASQGSVTGGRWRVQSRSVAGELLQNPVAEQALSALSMSADKLVQGWWYRLLASLAHAAGPSKEFQAICLPRLLLAVGACKDEARLLHLLEALRWLALQPACRKYLTTGNGFDTICVLINALPKWSARNLEESWKSSDVWPRLLENTMCVLQHTFEEGNCASSLQIPHGATAAVLCVLREAPFEHTEVQRGAVACLHSLAAACDPTASERMQLHGSQSVEHPSPAHTTTPSSSPCARLPPGSAGAAGMPGSRREVADGNNSGAATPASSGRRKGSPRTRDVNIIRELTGRSTIARLVELMVRGGDLHLRTSAARLLANLIIQRPNVCLEIAYVGISAEVASRAVSEESPSNERAYPVAGMRGDVGLWGTGTIDGITALLWLARDTGVVRGQVAAASIGSSDILCQRMVAKCLEAISLTCHMEPIVKAELIAMGYKDSEVGQAMRMAGGTSVECAVTWLLSREETPGGPEDEFEMVEDAPIDLPTMLISRGGLERMAEMLQEHDGEVQGSLWKAIAALTRVGARCREVLRSRIGYDWIVPLVHAWAGGAGIMLGTDRNVHMCAGVAGAGGSVRDSLGSCMLEVVANLAADVETCRELLPHGIVLLLASAACAARSGDVVGARTCARGLYYTLMNSPLHESEEQWEAWWPSESTVSGGTQALLHLCTISSNTPMQRSDTGVQRWTAMALHRLCVKASQVGWTALLDYMIANRGVQSILYLVYSQAVEVSTYAMATLALLSSASAPVFTSRSAEPVTARRALFLAGVMFPVNKIGRNGRLDAKLAAARILANLAEEEATLDDMLTGNDETLELAFHLVSLAPSEDMQTARRDGRFISSSFAASVATHKEALHEARIEMKEFSLKFLQAVCSKQKYHPRFLKLRGLEVLSDLAKSEACDAHKRIARGIVKSLESLAGNPVLRQVLNDNEVKNVAMSLFKRHGDDDTQIGASMERILILLARGDRDSTTNPSHIAIGDRGVGQAEGVAGAGWRVICQRSLSSGDTEQWVFSVAETLSFADLQGRVCRKFGPSVVITFQDEDEEWKVLSGDDMLAYAMSLSHAVRKRKLHIEVTVVTPLWEHTNSQAFPDPLDPETNPRIGDDEGELVRCASAGIPAREQGQHNQLMMSRLCDSSPSFKQHGEGSECRTLRWRVGKLIGEGAYAKVFQGINVDSGEFMAIKQVTLMGGHEDEKKRLEAVNALQREIEVMKQLQHDNIVKYLGTDTTDGRLNIFLEWVSGGSIAQLISNFGTLDEPIVRKYTRQIVVGLEFLHDKGIVHCDIKGGNILVTEDGVIKLADFNSSKQLGNIAGGGSNPLRSLLGTPQFMAPEVIRQTGHGKKADIWSVGCTVVQMLTGAPPWDEISNKITLMFHIASCKQPPSPPDNISDDAKEFLRQVLQIEPRDRPTCQNLLEMPFCIDREKMSSMQPASGLSAKAGQVTSTG